jgi:hypothetical protein
MFKHCWPTLDDIFGSSNVGPLNVPMLDSAGPTFLSRECWEKICYQ